MDIQKIRAAAQKTTVLRIGDLAVKVSLPTGREAMAAGVYRVQATVPQRPDAEGAAEMSTEDALSVSIRLATASIREVSTDGGATWEAWDPTVSVDELPLVLMNQVIAHMATTQEASAAAVGAFPGV